MDCKAKTLSSRAKNTLADTLHTKATRVILEICRLHKPRSLSALQVAGKCPDRMVGMVHHRLLKRCRVHRLCKRHQRLPPCPEGSQSGGVAREGLREPQVTGPRVGR
mmetsp:Transcript_54049/g.126878  ORF Transcript_54049/g.126878 Transcript_54049/m.126878 type:complete len:107 (+) Transcript_54049:595-915(+)